MTEFLELDDVLQFIADQGFELKDPGLLDSALMRPRTTVFGEDAYPDLATKAAAMMYSIAQNQPLVDGNKRLALLCAHAFLAVNGFRITADHDFVFHLLNRQIPEGFNDVMVIGQLLLIKAIPEQEA